MSGGLFSPHREEKAFHELPSCPGGVVDNMDDPVCWCGGGKIKDAKVARWKRPARVEGVVYSDLEQPFTTRVYVVGDGLMR